MFYVFGSALALFFDILLLSKKNKSLADKILTVWMFVLSIHLLLYYLHYTEFIYTYPTLMGLAAPFPFFHGPLLYLYTMSVTGRMIKWKHIMFLHFSPILIIYLITSKFLFTFSYNEKVEYVQRVMAGEGAVLFGIITLLMVIASLTYHILTFILYLKHRTNLKNKFSYLNDKINLNWLRNLIIGMTAIWLVVILGQFEIKYFNGDELIYSIVVLFIISIGFFGLKQGNIFVNPPADHEKKIIIDDERYAKSGLKEEEANTIEKQLKVLMEQDKLYLDENFSLPKLAQLINISQNYLSQVINERFDKNFYDFINSYRVTEFKEIAKEPKKKNYTILSLAYEAGFNSKSSFNKYFKKVTGQTPSDYLKSVG